jgi:hypothetical protein
MMMIMNHSRRMGGIDTAFRAVLLCFAAVVSGTAHGHGTPLALHYDSGTNRLSVRPYSTSPLTGGFFNAAGLTIYSNLDDEEAFFDFGEGLYWTDFPGFERASSLPANSTVSVRFLGPLSYWNPATQLADPLPVSNAAIEIVDFAEASGVVDRFGTSGTNPLALATFIGQTSGDHKHFTGYLLSPQVDPLIAADSFGLYGLWAAASATGSGFAGGTSLESDPFLIVLNYGITSSANYDEGVARLATTAVPEPSTLALVGAAFAVAGWRWRRGDARGSVSRRRARG